MESTRVFFVAQLMANDTLSWWKQGSDMVLTCSECKRLIHPNGAPGLAQGFAEGCPLWLDSQSWLETVVQPCRSVILLEASKHNSTQERHTSTYSTVDSVRCAASDTSNKPRACCWMKRWGGEIQGLVWTWNGQENRKAALLIFSHL